MIKRTLIAIAVAALVASAAQAALEIIPFQVDKTTGVKVDGKQTVRWPFEYKALDICCMPVYMKLGMFVKVKDCKDRKIVLEQVDCGDIGKGDGDFPCYLDCEKISVAANFEVKLGTRLTKEGPVIDEWEGYYNGTDIIPGDGDWHEVEVCVKAWKANLGKGAPGDETKVGTLCVTAKPNV